MLPGSLVVGEEGVAADPGVLEALSGDAPVWIIDPIDGTANFADGKPIFAVMVALVRRGETVAWCRAGRQLQATGRICRDHSPA